MIIKDAFVLAAGLGTRMGDLGKSIPKPLFPVFSKSIVEIIINQLSSLGIENIYMNSHHKEKVLHRYILSKGIDVKFLSERDLLGSGGAFYNLKSAYPHLGNVLSLNADTIFDFKSGCVEQLLSFHRKKKLSVSMMGLKVKETERFNRLCIKDGLLKNVLTYDSTTKIKENPYTFSGVSVVDLDSLSSSHFGKKTSYFDSVADFKTKKVGVLEFGRFSFHDFGTIDNYTNSLVNIIENKNDFIHSLVDVPDFEKDSIFCENDLCHVSISRGKLAHGLKE
jgi:NDP-sugar pyrophosphorylase family protein